MTVASNQYAAKSYAEHPIAIWPLDDEVSYLSLISESNRLLAPSWTLTNCTASNGVNLPDEPAPFFGKPCSELIGNVPVSGSAMMGAVSPAIFDFNILNQSMATFSINMYLYQNCVNINYYEIGFKYYDDLAAIYKEVVYQTEASTSKQWINFNYTFEVPEHAAGNCQIIIRMNIKSGGSSGQYNFILNGLSVGQWSETTSSKNLGAYEEALPQELASKYPTLTGVTADQYGILSEKAYYLVEDSKLLAKNEGVPLVFGSENVTKLYPAASAGTPSLLFPGKGFLTEDGKYRSYTLEFWLRIKPNTLFDRRIVGPIDSTDGLYVTKGFMTLAVNKNFITHNVNEWYRPMLIQIVYGESNISLIVNGEQVGSVLINKANLTLADESDWFGFFNYEDIDLFEIDCISVMPYDMQLPVAKRRFVWGQGVDSQQNIDASFQGETTTISFPNANYSVNSIYPDKEKWDAGVYNNLTTNSLRIASPNYDLPTIFLNGRNQNYWYSQNNKINNILYPDLVATVISASSNSPSAGYVTYETSTAHGFGIADYVTISGATNGPFNGKFIIESIPTSTKFVVKNDISLATSFVSGLAERQHPKFISFRPGTNDADTAWEPNNGDWTEQCYLEFSTANISNTPITTMYGIFEVDTNIAEKRTLIYIVNKQNNSNFEISINGYTITYAINGIAIKTVSISSSPSEHFVAGFNIGRLIASQGEPIRSFFSSFQSLQFYVGGNGTNTFEGKIYRVGFTDAINFNMIQEHFDSDGFPVYSDHSLFQGHYSTYTLSPFYRYGQFFLDISISASWQEYFPLQYFSKYVTNSIGDSVYDTDYLQFNIGYPSNIRVVKSVNQNLSWKYQSLKTLYSSPIVKTYQNLYNDYAASAGTYENLSNIVSNIKTFYDDSPIDIYLTFQLISEGANEPLESFIYTKELDEKNIVDGPSANTNEDIYAAYKTKFKIVDGTIIYPPRTIPMGNIAIVIYFEINQDAIITNPLVIRDMEITSKSLNYGTPNPINTKFGNYVYPYVKSGIYKDYKDVNPLLITKRDYPYLYLTGTHGIKILDTYSSAEQHSADIVINPSKKGKNFDVDPINGGYFVGGIQLFMKYDQDIPSDITPIFEIRDSEKTTEVFIIQDESGLRGKIYARDKFSRTAIDGLVFYQNGIEVQNPLILKDEWNAISIAFNEPLNYCNFSGEMTMFGGFTFNNVSYYSSSGFGKTTSTILRSWQKVLTNDNITNNVWLYWYNGVNSSAGISPTAPPPKPAGPYKKWSDVYQLEKVNEFLLTPSDIYQTYTGTNIKVFDDNSGISVKNEDFAIMQTTIWSSRIGKPV